MKFNATVIRKARFVYSPFTSEQMAAIATSVMDAVKARTVAGLNVEDNQAKPLKPGRSGHPGYPERKSLAGLPPIRNWVSPNKYPRTRIKTLRAMKVKSANENRAVIGFVDPAADRIAHLNNRLSKQFGLSPHDRSEALVPAVNAALFTLVTVKKAP